MQSELEALSAEGAMVAIAMVCNVPKDEIDAYLQLIHYGERLEAWKQQSR